MPGQIQVVKRYRRKEEAPVSEGFRDSYRDRHRLDPQHIQKVHKVGGAALAAPEELDVDVVTTEEIEPEFALGALAVEFEDA